MLLGAGCALSQSLLAHIRPGGRTLFDWADYLSSNLLMPMGGIAIALFVGWAWGEQAFAAQLSNQGQLHNRALARALCLLLRWVTPVLIGLVMLAGLGVFGSA
jgi:NSS family neurotransmitter:Na+ symporter